ncbi:MAG: ComEC/Rec2 family competence protein [bacterium]|nr:ComEC/Rec2 family competence protein [bacterium]
MKEIPTSRGCLLVALVFVCGIALRGILPISWVFVLWVSLLLMFSSAWRKELLWFGIWGVALSLGVVSYERALSHQTNHGLDHLFGTEVTFTGKVVREPEPRGLSLSLVILPDGNSSSRILVFSPLFSQVLYGERVRVTGVLQEPPVFDTFDYKAFLAKDGIHAAIWKSDISSVWDGRQNGIFDVFVAGLLRWKEKMRETLSRLPPPFSELLGAMLLGDSRRMGDDLKDTLVRSGMRHMTAISGLHVAMLSGGVLALFLFLGFWRQHATLLSLLFIILFVLTAGAPASAIRAGIMGGSVLGGKILGRPSASWRFLVFAGALMLAFNPLLLTRDIGFQLSFVAVAGILIFSPFFLRFLETLSLPVFVKEVSAVSLAAYISTAPLSLYHFSFLSLSAVLANIVAVPLLPFVLGIGLVFLLLGSLWGVFASVLSLPLIFFLSLVYQIASVASLVPGLTVQGITASVLALVFSVVLIGLALFLSKRADQFHSRVFW